jgi:hypothetical protein
MKTWSRIARPCISVVDWGWQNRCLYYLLQLPSPPYRLCRSCVVPTSEKCRVLVGYYRSFVYILISVTRSFQGITFFQDINFFTLCQSHYSTHPTPKAILNSTLSSIKDPSFNAHSTGKVSIIISYQSQHASTLLNLQDLIRVQTLHKHQQHKFNHGYIFDLLLQSARGKNKKPDEGRR